MSRARALIEAAVPSIGGWTEVLPGFSARQDFVRNEASGEIKTAYDPASRDAINLALYFARQGELVKAGKAIRHYVDSSFGPRAVEAVIRKVQAQRLQGRHERRALQPVDR